MIINYNLANKQVYVHYIGGYLAYSDHQRDCLSSLPRLALKRYTRTQTRREVTGTATTKEPVYANERYERPDGAMSTRGVIVSEKQVTHDIEEVVTRDVTPEPQKFGRLIAVGDEVAIVNDIGNAILRGTLTELTDWVLGIDRQLWFWSTQNLLVIRASDVVRRRR